MAFQPLVNGTYLVKLWAGGDTPTTATDYGCQIAEVAITPTAGDTNTFDPLCVDQSYTSVGPTTWAMGITYAQDWADVDSLARFLYDNDGAAISYELNPAAGPASATAPSFTGTGRCVAGPIGGGARGEFAEAEVELPLDGKPALIETPPVVLAADEQAAGAQAEGNGKKAAA